MLISLWVKDPLQMHVGVDQTYCQSPGSLFRALYVSIFCTMVCVHLLSFVAIYVHTQAHT